MTFKKLATLALSGLLLLGSASALAAGSISPINGKLTFVNSYRYSRNCNVSYYGSVYAVNHGTYGLQPFDSKVPDIYFIRDSEGTLALAPIVLDVTDAMRTALYAGDLGETALFYGQYCEMARAKNGKTGYTGVHEGIDFVNKPGAWLHFIMDGVVTRAGDRNGTVAVYNEEYNVTVLYLHCEDIAVRRGMKVYAGDFFAVEGSKGSGAAYTHVELRTGRHTTSNKYRNSVLESDCPYPVMQLALNVQESGRQAVTAAAVNEANRMRAEAEAEALRLAAEKAAAAATPEPTPAIELVDSLPGAADNGYGFDATPAPEATLPPAAN